MEGAIWARLPPGLTDGRTAALPWALCDSTVVPQWLVPSAPPECAALESPPREARLPASRCAKNGAVSTGRDAAVAEAVAACRQLRALLDRTEANLMWSVMSK